MAFKKTGEKNWRGVQPLEVNDEENRSDCVSVVDAPHIVVKAGAGTGKTFTMVEGFNRCQGDATPGIKGSEQQEAIWDLLQREDFDSALMLAFNKSIATELQQKLPTTCEAGTFHSICKNELYRAIGKHKVHQWKVYDIVEDLIGDRSRKTLPLKAVVSKLVGICKATLAGWDGEKQNDPTEDELEALCVHYGIETNGERDRAFGLVGQVLSRCMTNTKEIDFDDMLWLPIVLSIPMKKRDLLVVDEAQDLNRNQQEAALRLGNRIVIIGDINQAIYGFRGADVTSIPRMTDLLGETSRGVVELPLSFTRRCPKSHVAKANELVEDFHALPEAPEGSIESVKSTEFRGDLGNIVLGSLMMCRTNAPLVSYAFALIQEGIKAKIQGRDLGANLGALVKKLNRFTIGDLLEALSDYEDGEKSRILKEKYPSDSKLANLADKCQCIRFLCADCKDVDDVLKRIKDVFADMDNEGRPRDGVTLSSVHRAKGLEAKTTYILNPHLMPHPMAQTEWEQVQERNIMYVAWTRSLDTMIFVHNDEKD